MASLTKPSLVIDEDKALEALKEDPIEVLPGSKPIASIDPVEVARAKSMRDVDEIVDHTIMEIGKARDELDALMNDLGLERDEAKKAISRVAAFSAKAIKAKVIIADSLVKLRNEQRD